MKITCLTRYIHITHAFQLLALSYCIRSIFVYIINYIARGQVKLVETSAFVKTARLGNISRKATLGPRHSTRRCFLGFLCNCIGTCAGGQTSHTVWFQLTSIVLSAAFPSGPPGHANQHIKRQSPLGHIGRKIRWFP